MSDTAEVLLAIYDCVRTVAPRAVDDAFGLAVQECVHCSRCGRTTQEKSFTQYLHNTQATAVRVLHEAGRPFGALLRDIDAQAPKTCNADAGGCGHWNRVTLFLGAPPPRVFTLQLAWESNSERPGDIAATLAAVQERMDLADVYQAVKRGTAMYRLHCVVAYYGQHYQALVLLDGTAPGSAGGTWALYDDARGSGVGGWDAVARKCQTGRIQPSVLFYEAERAVWRSAGL